MFSDKKNVCQLVALLKQFGISHFVVSPGSRHIPIVISMQQDSFFKLYSVVDERSASFFAIGLIQQLKMPVGVICTSGTASANYCSAINESLYQELPLLVITADRQPCLLDQHEDQMIRQSTMFANITKKLVNLPVVTNEQDSWYNNRLINEALLELNHHGFGPVQLNIMIPQHLDNFSTNSLPNERKIVRYNLEDAKWNETVEYLNKKKILLVCGEGFIFNKEQYDVFNAFCNAFNVIVLCDKMSNCHLDNSIENAFPVLQALSEEDITELAPDLILTIRSNFSFNPEFKGFVARLKSIGLKIDNWYIHSDGRVVDPYQGLLTQIFEMSEFSFFKNVLAVNNNKNIHSDFVECWKIISKCIEEPHLEYGQVDAVGIFFSKIPNNSILHLANSNSVRVAQMFHLDPSIEIHCNRGTDGIDGCMSTAVGFASNTDKLTFLVIGDLTFFYDMNAIWNRQLSKNLRILLINNGGGSVMHLPARPDFALKMMPSFISAKHHAKAEAWCVDRGFKYLSARSDKELDSCMEEFVDSNTNEPVILEVFSEMIHDISQYKAYYAKINRTQIVHKMESKSHQIISKLCHVLGIDPFQIKNEIKEKVGENRIKGLKLLIKNH